MTRAKALLLLIPACGLDAISRATAAQTVPVCLVNQNALSRSTIQYLEAGLRAHEAEIAAVFRFTCESNVKDTVTIRLRRVPDTRQDPDALGASVVQNGEVLGQLEVFCESVRRMVRSRMPLSPALEGWALAKVAAHELYHYLHNVHDHERGSLNQKFMTSEGLIEGFKPSRRGQRSD